MIFKNINENPILRLAPLNNESILIADKALNNEFYTLSSLKYIVFKDKIDWNYTHPINANSYLLYLHSLGVVGYLCSAYELTKEKKYIEKSNEIMTSWINYEKLGNLSRMVWYDHTVAFRTQNILHFYILCKDTLNLTTTQYESLIMRHINYLYDDNKYGLYNHGIMMDKSLLACASVIEDEISENLKSKALCRLKDNFNNNFSYKGVHLENSLYYHYFTLGMYDEIEIFLNSINLSLGTNILSLIKKAHTYFNYAAKPNGELPLIGDSNKFFIDNKNKSFDSFFDYEAGIAYLQSLNKENPIDSTWISFICGYATVTHKHYDDLSFTLYYKGKDIFIDSGHFGYGDTKERRYIISQNAHTTFMIDDNPYELNKNISFNNIKITDFVSNKYYSLVQGKNTSYPNTKLYRTIILFNPDIIIIYDKGISKDEKVYTQIFNLAVNSVLNSLTDKECIINDNVEIIQINNTLESKFYSANRDIPIAIIAEKGETLTDVSQVHFKKKCSNINILTLISLDNSKNKITNFYFDEKNEILTISINGVSHSIVL